MALSQLEDLHRRAQLALQRQSSDTARKLWRELLEGVPTTSPDSGAHALALSTCFALQQSLDESDQEQDKDGESAGEQAELLQRALKHGEALSKPTSAQQDLEVGLISATLASLLLPSPPTGCTCSVAPKDLFDSALSAVASASTKRKAELLAALRPSANGAPGTSTESQGIAAALQVIYDAPSSHFIHLASGLSLQELDSFAKKIIDYFGKEVPGSMGTVAQAETSLNVGEVLCDQLEELQDDEDGEEEDKEEAAEKPDGAEADTEAIRSKAREWLQQAVSLFESASSQIPASQADELKFQLGHALSLLQDVTPEEDEAAGAELQRKLEEMGLGGSDDEWVDEEDA